MFRLGYNTNGLAHHRLLDALRLLAELGYEGVAITPDVGHLDPYEATEREIGDVAHWAGDLGLSLAIETGARFVMDARRKHFPTLLEEDAADRERRVDFLERCILLARAVGADVVSFWAGAAPGGVVADWPEARRSAAGAEPIWDRLVEGAERVIARARTEGVRVAFEPEPGMFVATPAGYEELVRRVPSGRELGLCLDVGHCLCTGDVPVEDVVRRFASRLAQVHLDDVRDGVHEHLPFGRGDLDLPGALNALLEVDYAGMAAVELSRDSHRGADAARESLEELRRALAS